MSARRMLAIARAEWLLNRRDPRSLLVILGLPVLLLVLYGYGLNFDQEHLPLAVQDLDRSPLSRAVVDRAQASGYFDIVAQIEDDRAIAGLLRSRRALIVLVIPPRFAEKVATHRQATLELVLDGSDSVTANTALGYARALVTRVSGDAARLWALRSGLGETGLAGIEVRTQVLYNPELNSAAFIVPGLIGVVMALMAALLTSTCIVREREVGTLEALLATPVRAPEVIVGKLLPYAAMAMADVALCVVAGALIFNVHPRGNLLDLTFVSAVFLLACLALGLAISGRAGSQRTAIIGGIMGLMLPTIILSGFVFPLANMPLVLRAVANAMPPTHYLVLARAVYLRGVSVFVFWPHLLALAGLTAVIFTVAVRFFRARL